jgi:hypothetical protein
VTVAEAVAPTVTETEPGVTDKTGIITLTATVLDVLLSLIVMVAEPVFIPLTVARPLAYVTVAMELSEEVALTVPEMLVTLILAVTPTPIVIEVGLTVAAQTLCCKNKTINKKYLNSIALFFIHCPILFFEKNAYFSEELNKCYFDWLRKFIKNGTDESKVNFGFT